MNSYSVYNLRLARTLYNNFYRARLTDANGEDAGQILIVPGLPLDRRQVPPDAPEANPYLLIIVEDANISKNTVVDFEEGVSRAVLDKFTTETMNFEHCEFYYPSPAFYFNQEDGEPEAPQAGK
ncbi:MAG: hypothetical protein I3I94_07155 [Acidaminococcaceae bacterium]|nr:hypothetical protein [Acidaminococcaceae bacterium]HCJ90309.1 hypothetical protein [Acidaminococcaceae bacterium]